MRYRLLTVVLYDEYFKLAYLGGDGGGGDGGGGDGGGGDGGGGDGGRGDGGGGGDRGGGDREGQGSFPSKPRAAATGGTAKKTSRKRETKGGQRIGGAMSCVKRKSVAWATGRIRNANVQKFGCSREGRTAGGQGDREIRYRLRYGLPVAHCKRCPRKRFTDAAQLRGTRTVRTGAGQAAL